MQSRRVLRSLIRQLVVEAHGSAFRIPPAYKDAIIEVVNSFPNMDDMWIGLWSYDDTLAMIIYLEREYADRLFKFASQSSDAAIHAQAILERTLEHEHIEATRTFDRAMKMLDEKGYTPARADQYAIEHFTGQDPIDWFQQLGGKIHFEIEPDGSPAYRQSMKDLRSLGYEL